LIVKTATPLNPEILRHGDLDALHMSAIPEWLEDRIHETEEQHIVNWPLPQVMVNTKDRLFVEGAKQNPVELQR
jgi:hypothetical protein